MNTNAKAYLLGGRIGSMAAAAFMIRDGGGRMLTTDNYECTWDLYKSIPSLDNEGKSVFEETIDFNETYKAHSMARAGVQKPRSTVSTQSEAADRSA